MSSYKLLCEVIKKRPVREIVKSPEWQKVRESLLGQWKKRPGWCCLQLRKYLGNIKTTSDDKLRILGNYLTSSGFRTGRIKHKCIQPLRDIIFTEMRRRKSNGTM